MSSLFDDLCEGLQQAIDYEKGVGEASSNPNILAKKAKKKINQMGYTNIICPRCNVSPEITRTTKGERTIVSCECGYIHDIEINL